MAFEEYKNNNPSNNTKTIAVNISRHRRSFLSRVTLPLFKRSTAWLNRVAKFGFFLANNISRYLTQVVGGVIEHIIACVKD